MLSPYSNAREPKIGDQVIVQQGYDPSFTGVVAALNPLSGTSNLGIIPLPVKDLRWVSGIQCTHLEDIGLIAQPPEEEEKSEEDLALRSLAKFAIALTSHAESNGLTPELDEAVSLTLRLRDLLACRLPAAQSAEEPRTEEPKTEAPKTEAPKTEARPAAAKTDSPKAAKAKPAKEKPASAA